MKCISCGEDRETKFYITNKSRCKACVKQYVKQWQKQHPDRTKAITKRKNEKRRQHQAEYYRRWYAEKGRNRAPDYADIIVLWQKNHPVEQKVWHIVKRAIQKGELTRPLYCALCGREGRIQAHHEDYSKAFDILWVCASCHKKIHLEA